MSRVTYKRSRSKEAIAYSCGGSSDVAFRKIEKDGVLMLKHISSVDEFSSVMRQERAKELEAIKTENRALRKIMAMCSN